MSFFDGWLPSYSILLYTIVYYCILSYIIVYYCILLYIIVYYCILLYIIVYYCILLYTIVYYCILLYIIVYYCILLYTIVYCCILLYIIVYYCYYSICVLCSVFATFPVEFSCSNYSCYCSKNHNQNFKEYWVSIRYRPPQYYKPPSTMQYVSESVITGLICTCTHSVKKHNLWMC